LNTLRIIYHGIRSRPSGGVLPTDYANVTVLRATWPPIHSTSIVLISASEVRTDDVQRFTPVFERFIGDAPITVRNIAPNEGYVDFWIFVDWDEPLDIAVDIVVLDPPALMVVVDRDMQNQETFQVDVRPNSAAGEFLGAQLSKAQQAKYQRLLVGEYGTLGHVKTSVKPSAKRKQISASKRRHRNPST
jgi:hypothetical protein